MEEEIIARFDQTCSDEACEDAQIGNVAGESLHGAAFNNSPAAALQKEFIKLWRTFRTMTRIEHTEYAMCGHFCVSLDVKLRYIDPLVIEGDAGRVRGAMRLSCVSKKSAELIEDFLLWRDTKYGCAAYADKNG